MINVGSITRWGIYLKFSDPNREDEKRWFTSDYERNKALRKLVKKVGPDKEIWTAKKCSE